MSLWRLRLGLLAAAVALVGVTGGLLASVQWGAKRDETSRADALRARVLDELERELTLVVDREEAHPFLHYRETWSPDGVALLRSPLATGDYPDDVLAYVQRDPEGNWTSPLPSANSALGLVLLEVAQPAVPAPAPRRVQVQVPLPSRPTPAPAPVSAPPAPPAPVADARADLGGVNISNNVDAVSLQLNRGGEARQLRSPVVSTAGISQTNVFATGNTLVEPPEPNGEGVSVKPQASDAVEQPRPTHVTVIAEVPGLAEAPSLDALDVSVSPMRSGNSAASAVILARDVRIAGRTWTQAVLLDREALQRQAAVTVLEQTGLSDLVHIDWSGTDYDFAEPFSQLSATVVLRDVDTSSLPLTGLWVLCGLVLLAGCGSLLVAERSGARLLAAAREREQFLATVTHELKTPVASMQLYAEMLDEGVASDPAQRARYFGVMRAESARLARLVEQTLTLTAEGTTTREPSAPVEASVRHALNALAPVLEARDVTVELDVSGAECVAPPDAIVQIVTNLVDNGSKFLRAGDPRVLRVALHGRLLSVRDFGPGVAKDELRRIFEPFRRLENEATRSTRGTGLGLAVVARLCERMGARVHAETADGGGLVVWIRLAR